MSFVELHCHLDGSVRPERLITEAKRLGRIPALQGFDTVEKLAKKILLTSPCTDLAAFLQNFQIIIDVLKDDATALENMGYDFYEDMVNRNIQYAEARYSAKLFADKKLSQGDVIEAVHRGFVKKQKEVNDPQPRCCQILCILTIPDNTADVCEEIVDLCAKYKANNVVVGIDIAGPADYSFKFTDFQVAAYKRAKELGINRTAHAGENSSAASVAQAIDELDCQRIGHGYHALDDAAVVQKVKDAGVVMEMCPRSSWLTNSVKDLSDHPLKRALGDNELKRLVTVNSDDPTFVGGFVDTDVTWAVDKLGVTKEQLVATIPNSLRAAFNPLYKQK